MLHRDEFFWLLGVTAPALPLFLFSRIKAGTDDMIIVRPRRELAVVFTPMLFYLACVIIVILHTPGQASVWLMLTAAVFCAALFSSVFNGAGVRASAERIELRRPAPALRNQWLPYVLAFGLGPHIDRWFRRFGAQSAMAGTHDLGGIGAGGSSRGSVSMPGGSWSGGGGSFGGAGSSASWVSAVGTIANGVSGAGSNGSGGGFSGGGGGGGSSGGGGGGGW